MVEFRVIVLRVGAWTIIVLLVAHAISSHVKTNASTFRHLHLCHRQIQQYNHFIVTMQTKRTKEPPHTVGPR